MSKTKHNNIPQLRFAEFKGNWDLKKLGQVGNFLGGGTPSTKNPDYWSGKLPWISSSDLSDQDMFNINIHRYISEKAVKQSATKIIPPKSILIVSRVGVGKIAINDRQLCTSQDFTNLVPTKGAYLFLAYLIKIKTSELLGFNQGTSIKGFVKNDLETLKIEVPSKPEQQKIADFLSSVDKKIQQLTRKKKLLEQYKKGVMQKIFSQEIRFKPALSEVDGGENGKGYPDWEEKRLGDILTFISTNSFSRNDLNYENGELKNIHYGDIHTKFKMGFDFKKEKVPFINKEINLEKVTKEQFCQVGDIVVADASEDYKDIGKTIEILNIENEKILAGLHTFLARDVNQQTLVGFKGYLFQTWNVRKQIMRMAQGISVLGISKKNLLKVRFLLPCKDEQYKIADILKSIDRKIEGMDTQLNQTQQFKKGLLQQMFV